MISFSCLFFSRFSTLISFDSLSVDTSEKFNLLGAWERGSLDGEVHAMKSSSESESNWLSVLLSELFGFASGDNGSDVDFDSMLEGIVRSKRRGLNSFAAESTNKKVGSVREL